MSKQTFSCKEQPIARVIVFTDRAEVKRIVNFELEEGDNEIVLAGVTCNINDDSVRVNGKGDAVIQEVQVKQKATTEGENDSPEVAEYRSKIHEKEKELTSLHDRKKILGAKIEALDGFLKQVGVGVINPREAAAPFRADSDSLSTITNFFEFYDTQSLKARTDIHDLDEEIKKAEDEKNVLQHELDKRRSIQYSKEVTVLVHSGKGGPAELEFVYQIWGANWSPFYDLRVDTNENQNMEISYFANVTQSSGEDWEGGQLVLSTAQPSLGGNIPEIGTLQASFYRPPPPPQQFQTGALFSANSFGAAAPAAHSFKKMRAVAMDSTMAEAEVMMCAQAGVSEQKLSTEFAITRPCSIPADGQVHKVTIGIVTLTPSLLFESVPSKSTSVFLTSSAVNTSQYPFLPGNVSVYLDNAFVAKTWMSAVSPGERFKCSLGIDHSIKIEYKPAHKHHAQVGIINKNTSMAHEQKIAVKNTKKEDILLTIKEHVPLSTDEKIKVKLVEPADHQVIHEDAAPSTETPSPGARLTPASILEWTFTVGKGKTENIAIKWNIEHPHNEKLEFNEKFSSR